MAKKSSERHQDPDELMFSPTAACYNPERDGSLVDYLEKHNGDSSTPLFKGIEHFELLKSEGWLAPGMSTIRLMWNVCRDDEYFGVTEKFELEGIQSNAHAGQPGVHKPEDIFKDAPPFEAHSLYGPAWQKQIQELEDAERKRLEELGLL